MPAKDQRRNDSELECRKRGEGRPPVELEHLRDIAAGGEAEVEGEGINGHGDQEQDPGHPPRDRAPKEACDHYRMFPHPWPPVYVAALSLSRVGYLTVDSQAGWVDPR